MTLMSHKIYADRDIEAQGKVYLEHVGAMTFEDLNSKSDIAAELAHRDIRITKLETAIKVHKEHLYDEPTNGDLALWKELNK